MMSTRDEIRRKPDANKTSGSNWSSSDTEPMPNKKKTEKNLSNLNFVDFALGCAPSLLLRCQWYAEYKLRLTSIWLRTNGREREGSRNFFFCLLYLYFFLISVFHLFVFFFSSVVLWSVRVISPAPVDGVPFSHSAYIEFCPKKFICEFWWLCAFASRN